MRRGSLESNFGVSGAQFPTPRKSTHLSAGYLRRSFIGIAFRRLRLKFPGPEKSMSCQVDTSPRSSVASAFCAYTLNYLFRAMPSNPLIELNNGAPSNPRQFKRTFGFSRLNFSKLRAENRKVPSGQNLLFQKRTLAFGGERFLKILSRARVRSLYETYFGRDRVYSSPFKTFPPRFCLEILRNLLFEDRRTAPSRRNFARGYQFGVYRHRQPNMLYGGWR